MATVGNSWQQLAIVGNSWQQLSTVGNSWHQLATVGNSWQRLATVGNNLLTFLCALQPTQFQSKYTHIIFKRSFLFVFLFSFYSLGPPPPKVQLCDEQKIKWAWPYRKVKYLHLRCCVCTIAKNLITIRIELYSNSFFPFYWCNRIKLIFEMQKKISKKNVFTTIWVIFRGLKSALKKLFFLFLYSRMSNFKYIKYFTYINSCINYFNLQSLPIKKILFSFFNFGGKKNLYWYNDYIIEISCPLLKEEKRSHPFSNIIY